MKDKKKNKKNKKKSKTSHEEIVRNKKKKKNRPKKWEREDVKGNCKTRQKGFVQFSFNLLQVTWDSQNKRLHYFFFFFITSSYEEIQNACTSSIMTLLIFSSSLVVLFCSFCLIARPSLQLNETTKTNDELTQNGMKWWKRFESRFYCLFYEQLYSTFASLCAS